MQQSKWACSQVLEVGPRHHRALASALWLQLRGQLHVVAVPGLLAQVGQWYGVLVSGAAPEGFQRCRSHHPGADGCGLKFNKELDLGVVQPSPHCQAPCHAIAQQQAGRPAQPTRSPRSMQRSSGCLRARDVAERQRQRVAWALTQFLPLKGPSGTYSHFWMSLALQSFISTYPKTWSAASSMLIGRPSWLPGPMKAACSGKAIPALQSITHSTSSSRRGARPGPLPANPGPSASAPAHELMAARDCRALTRPHHLKLKVQHLTWLVDWNVITQSGRGQTPAGQAARLARQYRQAHMVLITLHRPSHSIRVRLWTLGHLSATSSTSGSGEHGGGVLPHQGRCTAVPDGTMEELLP